MFLFVIIFAMFVSGAEVDIAVPSFPEMRSFFQINPFMVELVLGINLLAHCIAALYCGNLGDKYGKKQVINYGFAIFTLGSLMCAISNNFAILLFGRILQGIGVAPAMVLTFIIGIEAYEEKEKISGILNGTATLAISIAPTIGSYINHYFGWRGNFWILFIFGLLAMITFSIFIPSDKKHDQGVKIKILDYFLLLKNKLILHYVLALCFAIGAYYTFVALAPLLFIEAFGVEVKRFGFYSGALTLTFGIFSIVSGKVIHFIGKKVSILISLIFVLLFILLNLIFILIGVTNPVYIICTMILLSIGFVIPFNIMFVLLLDINPEAKGRVSALISTTKWIFAIIGIQIASYFYVGSYRIIGVVTSLMVLFAIILFAKLWKIDYKLKTAFGF